MPLALLLSLSTLSIDCPPVAEPETPVSFPPDGAIGVPTDLQRLRMFMGCGWIAEVELDGEPLTTEETATTGWTSVVLPPLEPNTVYTYTVSTFLPAENLEGPQFGPATFETGDLPAEPPKTPNVSALRRYADGAEHCRPHNPVPANECTAIYAERHPAPPDALHFAAFPSKDDNAVLWRFSGEDVAVDYVEPGCPPRFLLDSSVGSCERNICINIAPVGPDGLAGPAEVFCEDEDWEPEPEQEGGPENDDGIDPDTPRGYCRVSKDSAPDWAWLVLLLVWRRRSQDTELGSRQRARSSEVR